MKKDDLKGLRFGRLLVIKEATGYKKLHWLCKCDCGNFTAVCPSKLKNGETKSCGCLRKETTSKNFYKHGHYESRLYTIYTNMKTRCYNCNASEFYVYGGKGVRICEEWLGEKGFENFYNWALANGYDKTLSIDRVDNDKGYSPDNCRWATRTQQARNKTNNRKLYYKGKMYCLSEALLLSKVKTKETITRRLKKGWTVEQAIETPSKTYKGEHYGS